MSFIADLLNPISPGANPSQQYQFDNSVHDTLQALTYVMNPSVVTNANFATLGSHGQSLITTDTDISSGWNVVGAAGAAFGITSLSYPANSLIKSASAYYLHCVVSSWDGSPFYFYQQQNATVRKYQKNYLTYGIIVKNNQTKPITIAMDVFSFYDPSSTNKRATSIFLAPGLNTISSKILTDSLDGISVGSNPYTQFRFSFLDLGDGTADIELYQIKCEFGITSTLLQQ